MRIKEILIQPWETPDAKFTFQVWTDDWKDDPPEIWELTCINLGQTEGLPLAVFGHAEIKLYDDHPLLWNKEVYFTITGGVNNIPEVMGDLFIEHSKTCGNWIDFSWIYGGLPTTLETLRENQLAIPTRLKDSCFEVFKRHGVQFRVNSVEDDQNDYRVLFFSNEDNWPDSENFRQPYIIAKKFTARKV